MRIMTELVVASLAALFASSCSPKKKSSRVFVAGSSQGESAKSAADASEVPDAKDEGLGLPKETKVLDRPRSGSSESEQPGTDESQAEPVDTGQDSVDDNMEVDPPANDPFKVMFTIPPSYDGTAAINTKENPIKLKVYPGAKKQELLITNMSDQPFRLHSGGAPCGHAPESGVINKGQSYACVVENTIDIPVDDSRSSLYDHNKGRATSIFMEAAVAADPEEVN